MRFTVARRIGRDLQSRRNLEAYVVASAALAFAAVSLLGDGVAAELRWTVVLAGIGLLVYEITVPVEHPPGPAEALADRTAFDGVPLGPRLRAAREIWLFAPSAAHVLTSENCDTLRRHVLDRSGGCVRVVVLDPGRAEAVRLAAHQLTDSVDFPGQRFERSLAGSMDRLRAMTGWRCAGRFEFRLFGYNPGFSLLALDPNSPEGVLIVEFHGVHNESTSARPHLTLTRSSSQQWFDYWLGQYAHIWQAAQIPSSQ